MPAVELIKGAEALRGCLAHLKTTSGRRRHAEDEDPFPMPNIFVSDEAKLLSSKAFRLLWHKTQVVTKPENPFIRTRGAHVMEVVADSIVVADMLGLNVDLARAIAIGHDIGHVPFGHPGEHFLAEAMGRPDFCHEVMGVIIAQRMERRGNGLNLTRETLEGMMCHSGNRAREGMTPEAWVVRYTDKFAYLFADYNDLDCRMRYPLPRDVHLLMREFGGTQRERTSAVMAGLIAESADAGRVRFEQSPVAKQFAELRSLMMGVYRRVTQQHLRYVMDPVLEFLTETGIANPFLMFALMTDDDVNMLFKETTKNFEHLQHTALRERLEFLPEVGEIDLCDPDLDW